MRKWLVVALVVLVVGSAGGIGRPDAYRLTPAVAQVATTESAAGPQIGIAQFTFSPGTLTVPVGTTVTWTNRDADSHTITSTDGVFASTALDNGETFSFRFSAPGTYSYYCALHPHMTARIIVN